MFSGSIINHIGHLLMSMLENKTRRKSTYHTKCLKINEMGGHQNICMQTHLTYLLYPEKVFMLSLFVLGYLVQQTMRQHFPVFKRAPC